jgi:predicted DNA-binding transcriptional regulator AlpA
MKFYPPKRELHLARPAARAAEASSFKTSESPATLQEIALSGGSSSSASGLARSSRQASAQDPASAIPARPVLHAQVAQRGATPTLRTQAGSSPVGSFGAAIHPKGTAGTESDAPLAVSVIKATDAPPDLQDVPRKRIRAPKSASTPSDPERLLDENELAARLGMAPPTLRNWRTKGLGPRWIRLPRRAVRYRRADVEEWLA